MFKSTENSRDMRKGIQNIESSWKKFSNEINDRDIRENQKEKEFTFLLDSVNIL